MPRPLQKSVALGVAFLCLSLGGCQSLSPGARLYSEKRDKQGVEAKASWEKVKIDGMIATERGNLNTILESQLDLQEKYAINQRDRKLRAIFMSESKVGEALGGSIAKDFDELIGVGKEPNTAAHAFQLRQQAVSAEPAIAMKMAATRFSQVQLRLPACSETEFVKLPNSEDVDFKKPVSVVKALERLQTGPSANARKAAVLESGIKYLVKACPNKSDPLDKFRKLENGILQEALQDQTQDADALASAREIGTELQAEFDASSEAYTKLAGNKPASDAPPAAPTASGGDTACVAHPTDKLSPSQLELAQAADRVCKAIQQIEKADNAFANKLLSEERLKSLQDLVETINQVQPGDPVPDDASRLTKSYILLPGLVDEIRAAIAAKKKPVTMSLLIQKNIDQLKLDAASREIALLEARAALSRLIVEEILMEGELLLKAKTNLRNNARLSAMSMDSAFAKAELNDKVTLYSTLTNYADAIGRQEAKWRKARQQRLATYHEIAVLYAEVNLRQWTSLIDTAVQQVGDSAAEGVKAESITNILNTLGLFYIGAGVHK
jgi:hypothetical protein